MERPGRILLLQGMARLPSQLSGEHGLALMLELGIDTEQGVIADVSTNMNLPQYDALLREVLIGRRLADVDACADEFAARCRCPLAKPTLAALRNALGRGEA